MSDNAGLRLAQTRVIRVLNELEKELIKPETFGVTGISSHVHAAWFARDEVNWIFNEMAEQPKGKS